MQLKRAQGFTLIELTVVIVVLTVVVGILMPNLVAQRDALQRRQAYDAAFRLAQKGRELAISNGVTYELTYEDGQAQLLLNRVETSTDDNQEEDRQSEGQVDLPDGISASGFQQDAKYVSAAEWKLRFFPDGRSDGGGVELEENNFLRSIEITPEGNVRLIEGQLPDRSADKWQAGDYEHRQ